MRKPVLPRILLFSLLYFIIFIVLVSVQFSRPEGFTMRTGSFVVTGSYRLTDVDETDPDDYVPNEYIIEGDVQISFGGIDFYIVKGRDDPSILIGGLIEGNEIRDEFPERMIIEENAVCFIFPGGSSLDFTSNDSWGSPEMRISAVFSEDVSGIELPFKPQRRTGIQNAGDGQFIFRVGRINYTFGLSQMDAERRVLRIEPGRPVSYRAILDSSALSLADFILPQAESAEAYDEALTQWRNDNFLLWTRVISTENNEDLVMALVGEAFLRGRYSATISAIPQAFLRGTSRSYESSPYLGSLVEANRILTNSEREKLSRITRLINEKFYDFLLEPDVFEYLSVRGHNTLVNSAWDLVDTMDTAALTPDIAPGIFEGFLAWRNTQGSTASSQGLENPFERIIDDVCQLIFRLLRKTEDGRGVFVSYENEREGQAEFNLRLGKAILLYAEAAQNDTWAGIGRSLVLSSLSTVGGVDSTVHAAKLYRILNPLETYPRALPISAAANNAWAWTTAVSLSAVQQNDILDISVNFPAGETHYMIIRGIRPFVRMQLYNMDYRTDPQFETYDSSGWSYIQQDQTLIVKMRHRDPVERIRIIFREAPRPVVVPEPVVEESSDAANGVNPGVNPIVNPVTSPGLVDVNLGY